MKIKFGVALNLNEKMYNALVYIVEDVFNEHDSILVITSGSDGEHSELSKHYKNDAIDCRTRHLKRKVVLSIAATLRNRLGTDFDVVVEGTHLHIEYDPK